MGSSEFKQHLKDNGIPGFEEIRQKVKTQLSRLWNRNDQLWKIANKMIENVKIALQSNPKFQHLTVSGIVDNMRLFRYRAIPKSEDRRHGCKLHVDDCAPSRVNKASLRAVFGIQNAVAGGHFYAYKTLTEVTPDGRERATNVIPIAPPKHYKLGGGLTLIPNRHLMKAFLKSGMTGFKHFKIIGPGHSVTPIKKGTRYRFKFDMHLSKRVGYIRCDQCQSQSGECRFCNGSGYRKCPLHANLLHELIKEGPCECESETPITHCK